MCQFTRTLHVCGHAKYILKTPCKHSFKDPATKSPSCRLIKTPVGPPPAKFITETISYQLVTCGTDTCIYTPTSDPFLPDGAVVKMPPGISNPRANTWNSPPPLATKFRGSLGRVSKSQVVESATSNASILSVGSKQFQWRSRPNSASPPSLDDEMAGKQTLYDELLPYGYEIPSEDYQTPRTPHTPNRKRKFYNSPTPPSSPPQPGSDCSRVKKRKIRNLPNSEHATRPKIAKRKVNSPNEMTRRMAEMKLRSVPLNPDADEMMSWEC